MRIRLLIGLLGLVAMLAAWFAVRAVEDRRIRSELSEARRELASRRPAQARLRLIPLARRRPGDGEVAYLLGCCEMAGGHVEAALEAWARVPPDSPEGPMAALAQGRHARDVGRYGLAEAYLDRATRAGGEVGDEAWRLLEWLYWMTGRRDEYRGALRRQVEKAPDPSEGLRALWGSDYDPYPLDAMTEALARARRAAPEDDRVWLALADLARRSGRLEEADDWLRRCERSRPEDPAVCRARLEWARAAGRVDEFARAASRLPASTFEPAQVIAMRAWLAARNGDIPAERSALQELIALEPGRNAAIERLADLAAQAGDLDQVAELRRRKAALEAAHVRYAALIILPDLAKHAADLAREAEALGRWFDARAWWELAARQDPALKPRAAASRDRWARTLMATRHDDSTLAQGLGLTSPAIAASARPRLEIPTFVDEAGLRGLEFTFDNGPGDNRQLPETMSGGVAVLDFDGDGWLDIYAVQGGPFPPPAGARPVFGDRLFRNLGDGRFRDVTAASGLAGLPGGYGHGVAVGDYDKDGRPDLFVTRWRSYALYHNLGRGRFEDVTGRAGLGGDRDWPTSAAWADLDNDGDLDLYVCHYLKWDAEQPTLCDYPGQPERGHAYCDPRLFPALPDHLFRNDDGRFADATCTAGVVEREGRGLGVVAADLDGDGKTDLFVANDTTANNFFHNRGDLRFSERALEAGLASSGSGGNLAGMGIACGDFDGDGRIDLAVTNFFDEATTLYHNHGEGLFSDRSAATGLAAATRLVLGFGLAALDANNDGRLDLVQANGHVSDNRPRLPYAMPPQLLLGDEAGRFVDVSSRAGEAWKVPRLGRGLAVADIDNDGRMDVLIVGQGDPLALLRNQPAAGSGHWLTLALEGTASNRDGVGATVAVTAGGRSQVAARFGGGSYLSASDPRLHFGLGSASRVDRVEVRWPSGRRDTFEGLAADAGYRLREGDPKPAPLSGFASTP